MRAPADDVETLAFAVREGRTDNHFLRRGPVAAHLLVTSGTAPRILVAFPAGNTGAALWFETLSEPAALAVEGGLVPVEEGAMRGISATLSIAAPELRVRRAVLGSVRAIRAFAHGGTAPVGLVEAFDEGPPFTIQRTMEGGRHQVTLRLVPQAGASVRAGADGRIAITAAPGEALLRVTVTVLADDPPLTPIPRSEILLRRAEVAEVCDVALSALAFLSYEEKLLAGSWRFLTYFGRDTLLSLRLLLPVLRPRVVESGLGAVLDRIGPEGDVAHEEAVGEWAAVERAARGLPGDPGEPALDRSMVDDDFLLAPLVAAYLLDGAGRPRAATFLARRTPAGDTYAATLAHNLARVLRLAAPFAAMRDARALISLREGHAAGEWRDSEEGLGGGRTPFDVNAALVPAALDAAARLFASGLLGADRVLAEHAASLAAAYRGAGELFRVEVPAAEARRRGRRLRRRDGARPRARARVHRGRRGLPALALDAAGAPIPVMHSDDGFVLLFTDPSSTYLEEAAGRIVRPFPAGLRTPAGLVVANPAFCPERAVRDLFTAAHYHGTVVWAWQHALLAAGVRRQLSRVDLPPRTRAALSPAGEVLGEIRRASLAWQTSELWSVAVSDGKLTRVPFGARREHHDESNAAQLWSTVVLAVED